MKKFFENTTQGTQINISHLKINSPLGELMIVCHDDKAITAIIQEKQPIPTSGIGEPVKEHHQLLHNAEKQLNEYFDGSRNSFSIPLELVGTPFQQSVWRVLMGATYGDTVYYADIAQALDNSRATQAVGSAVGKNPLSIVSPCHRVIAQSGKVNYAGGVENKEYLLSLENKYSR